MIQQQKVKGVTKSMTANLECSLHNKQKQLLSDVKLVKVVSMIEPKVIETDRGHHSA